MIRIAVCDDEVDDVRQAASMCDRLLECRELPHIISTFSNPVDMIAAIDDGQLFDLLLMDIYMPGLLGTEAIAELRANGSEAHVVFLTTSRDHAYEAFGLQADNYLVKPYDYVQFEQKVNPSIDGIEREQQEMILLKTKSGLQRVLYDDIVYCETSGHNQAIHLRDHAILEVRASSKVFFDRLSGDNRFFKAGSTYIINLDCVRGIKGSDVSFSTGECIAVPMRSRKDLEEAFIEHTFDAF